MMVTSKSTMMLNNSLRIIKVAMLKQIPFDDREGYGYFFTVFALY